METEKLNIAGPVGMGYSNDMREIAPKACFNGTSVNDRKVKSTRQLDGGVSYEDFR